ncbi:LysR family transcriptional regulator [Roseomonas sp. OT10]|uniref:LysR family transcriptional regulator n=1 Tax=Roseomonas cutis TaxID=2897332 RepID=UPI001E361704|nr:LysR family transcriptional regulator [Roseomonas sp. OT10]UFN47676.1 LysR family transcriptional regulator [Roseomonas sp. OT10]
MDLQAIRYFVATVRAGSFAGAAAQLGLTQPAVARQVRLLERELGVPLVFAVTPRRLAPTPSGEAVLARAQQIEEVLAQLRRDAVDRAAEPNGPLCVALPPVIGATLMHAALPNFIARFPKIRLRVLSGYSGYVEDWVSSGEAEIGLMFGEPRRGELEATPLLEQEICLIAPAAASTAQAPDGLAGRQSCTLAEVARLPLVLPGLHHGLRIVFDEAVERAGLKAPQIVVEADNIDLLKLLVIDGRGYSVLSADAVRAEVGAGTMRALPIAAPRLLWRLSFVEQRDRYRSLAVAAFKQAMVETTIELLDLGTIRGNLLHARGHPARPPRPSTP